MPLRQWQDDFAGLRRSNLLQAYNYGRALAPIYGQKPRWGLIEIDGAPAGMLQIMEASILGGLIHAVLLDRGPLWFDGYGTPEHCLAFIEAYSQTFPKRFGRRRRFLPEWGAHPDLDAALRRYGWTKQDGALYETLWLDPTQEEDNLHRGLRKSWRQSLTKAQASALEIVWDTSTKALPLHLTRYHADKQAKAYSGPDVPVVQALARGCAQTGDLLLGTAMLDKQPIAGIMILCHGRSATYQIGWSEGKGRATCAHHRLLWEGALTLKAAGITDLDLGGTNETTAKAIKTFKRGLGGQAQTLAGLYC